MSESGYESFSEIYDVWTESAVEVCDANRRYYVEQYLAASGPVIELGVGNGRIALEAARRGVAIVGVDDSNAMLALCRTRAKAEGIADLLQLIQADMREFTAPEPAALISLPFHSIGHLIPFESKRELVQHVFEQLAPGGRFLFDAFVFDPEIARIYSAPSLRAEYTDEATGRDVLLWVYSQYFPDEQRMRVFTWTDELDGDGVVARRKYRRLDFSWLDPEQARALLEEAGFEIEAVYGDFERTPFGDDSREHVWVARRP